MKAKTYNTPENLKSSSLWDRHQPKAELATNNKLTSESAVRQSSAYQSA